MAEERESQKSHAKGETDVEGHGQVGAQVGAQSGAPEADFQGHGQHPMTDDSDAEESKTKLANDEADFQGHGQHPMTDDSDPDESKTKLANDEDDDVEAHANHPHQSA